MASSPITSWQIDGETMEMVTDFIFLGSKINVDDDCSHEIKRHSLLGRKAMTNLDSILKSRDIILPTNVHIVKAMIFPVVMYRRWELDNKKDWEPKNWCIQTGLLEKTLESPLECKEIKPVNPKGNQPWILTARADAEALILWPPDGKSWLIGKNPDAGKDWRQEEKGMTEDEMVGWHHWLDGHEFEKTLGDSEGQGSPACCSSWGCKESDTTEWLNNNNGYLLHSEQNLNSSTMAKHSSRIYLPLSWPHFVLFFLGLCFGSSNKHFFLDQGPISLLSTLPW